MSGQPRRGGLPYIIGTVGFLLLAALAFGVWRTVKHATDLRAEAYELQELAQQDPADLDIFQVSSLVHRARVDAEQLYRTVHVFSPLTNRLGWVPKYGPLIAAADSLAEFAFCLTTTGDELLNALAPLITWGAANQEQAASLSTLLALHLEQAESSLALASASMNRAQIARSGFDLADLPASIQGPITKIDQFLPLGVQGVRIAQMLPSLLGVDEKRVYLLIAQNHDELRATGGFISGVGTLVIERGDVLSVDIGDSYDVDDLSKVYPVPPEPLLYYMGAAQWLVRDANWSPDFPTTARTLQSLYTYSTDMEVDGVVAFDQTALQRVLAVTGPIDLLSAPEPLSSENIEQYMQQAWAPGPEQALDRDWWEHRKDFMGELGSAILDMVQASGDRQLMIGLARAGLSLIKEKHLLIYLNDPSAAFALGELGWDGSIQPGSGDFLMVVDSNVGFNKVDPNIQRSVRYQLDLRDPVAPSAKLTLSYTNTVTEEAACEHRPTYGEGEYADMQRRCYWGYVRVYTPPGSTFLLGDLPPTPGDWLLTGKDEPGIWTQSEGEDGAVVFGGVFVLPVGSEASLSLEYSPPDTILASETEQDSTYSLRIVKQPGTLAVPIEVLLALPEGCEPVPTEMWEAQPGDGLRWSGNLLTDLDLYLAMRCHEEP